MEKTCLWEKNTLSNVAGIWTSININRTSLHRQIKVHIRGCTAMHREIWTHILYFCWFVYQRFYLNRSESIVLQMNRIHVRIFSVFRLMCVLLSTLNFSWLHRIPLPHYHEFWQLEPLIQAKITMSILNIWILTYNKPVWRQAQWFHLYLDKMTAIYQTTFSNFQIHFHSWKYCILIRISLKFVP